MRRRITYANVAATVALVFSMTGGAIAANHYLINSTKQINPKVLKKLKGKTGKAGARGATGATGATGAAGKDGAPGKEGPRGPGIVASGSSGVEICSLKTSTTTCFPSITPIEFTPSSSASCFVTAQAQVSTPGSGKPTTNGPFFRLQISENGTEKNDETYGLYFEGTEGTQSTVQTRTRFIPVTAGTAYNFGTYYGGVSGEWLNQTAFYEVTYTCYGT